MQSVQNCAEVLDTNEGEMETLVNLDMVLQIYWCMISRITCTPTRLSRSKQMLFCWS